MKRFTVEVMTQDGKTTQHGFNDLNHAFDFEAFAATKRDFRDVCILPFLLGRYLLGCP